MAEGNGRIDVRFLSLGLAVAAQFGAAVWFASNLAAEIRHADFKISMLEAAIEKQLMSHKITHEMVSSTVDENSSFRELWPSGKWGAGELPSDTRQDLYIKNLQDDMDRVKAKLFNGHPGS